METVSQQLQTGKRILKFQSRFLPVQFIKSELETQVQVMSCERHNQQKLSETQFTPVAFYKIYTAATNRTRQSAGKKN